MPTNPKGYLAAYYKRERAKIIDNLGGCCQCCGTIENLEIHHDKRWSGPSVRGRGRMERLADWRRNIQFLRVFCRTHHREEHYANKVVT
jgi:hypothetical protein